MKMSRTLCFAGAFGFLIYCHAVAQTTLLKPAITRSFGENRVSVPALRSANVYGCYEVLIPGSEYGTPYSPAQMDNPYGYAVRDRAQIAPGVEIKVVDIKNDMDKDFDENKPPPPISIAGRKQTIDFGQFLVDPKLWSHSVLNGVEYRIGIHGMGKNAYRFIGLVQSHGKTYLGVAWYSSQSENPDEQAVVFRLNWNGKTVEPTPIHEISEINFKWPPLPLLLDTVPNGDLLLSVNGNLQEMNEKGEWSASTVSAPLIKKYPQLAAYSMRWLVGQWLITGHQQASGDIITFNLIAADAATGKKVREFKWSVRAK